MAYRLDDLSANVIIKYCENINAIFEDILIPPSLQKVLDKHKRLWQDIANIIIFCGGRVYGPSWNLLMNNKYTFDMMCSIGNEEYNTYVIHELDKAGLITDSNNGIVSIHSGNDQNVHITMFLSEHYSGHGLSCGCFTDNINDIELKEVDKLFRFTPNDSVYILEPY